MIAAVSFEVPRPISLSPCLDVGPFLRQALLIIPAVHYFVRDCAVRTDNPPLIGYEGRRVSTSPESVDILSNKVISLQPKRPALFALSPPLEASPLPLNCPWVLGKFWEERRDITRQ